MSNRNLVFMTILVLVCMGAMLILNITSVFSRSAGEKYLSYNGVRGMAIEHNKILYTLSFDQQNKMIEHINLSLAIGGNAAKYDKSTLDFEKIIIYLFNAPDLVLTPIAYYNQNLIYSVPAWNPQGYMQDISYGSWKNLISQTYDP